VRAESALATGHSKLLGETMGARGPALFGYLTTSRFESWIEAAILESSLQLRLLAVDHAQKGEGLWGAALSGREGETLIQIDANKFDTEASMKDEIRRQLESHRRQVGL
jgi:hypothetical protein